MKKQKNIINPQELNTENNFSVFYNSYFRRFVKYAFFYVNDLQVAEDMTHDAILYYWENRKTLSPDIDVLGYILLSVKNKCLNYLKHLKVEAAYNENYKSLYDWEIDMRIQTLEDEEYSTIFSKDIMRIVMKSLSELPEQTRRIFVMNRLENKSRKEIALLLGVSIQKVDYHVNKASGHLLQKLKDYVPLIILFLN